MRALNCVGVIVLLVGCSVHGNDVGNDLGLTVSDRGQKLPLMQAKEEIEDALAPFTYVEDIQEHTTEDIWDKLGGQIFTIEITGGTTATFWMKGEKVLPIGSGWGSMGPHSFCTSDLDQDGVYELLYMYCIGDGLSRTSLMGVEDDVLVDGDYVFEFNVNYLFKKIDDQEILIMKGEDVIGGLNLDEADGRKILRVSE